MLHALKSCRKEHLHIFQKSLFSGHYRSITRLGKKFQEIGEEFDRRNDSSVRKGIRGPLNDIVQFTQNGGKMFESSLDISTVHHSPKVPHVDVDSLSSESFKLEELLLGKITFLCTFSKKYGQNLLPLWLDEFENRFRKNPNVQAISLSIIDEWYFKFFKNLFLKGLKSEITENEFHRCFACFMASNDFKETLKFTNNLTAYVHLIDAQGRIRWSACGEPTPRELSDLGKFTLLLEQQQQQNPMKETNQKVIVE